MVSVLCHVASCGMKRVRTFDLSVVIDLSPSFSQPPPISFSLFACLFVCFCFFGLLFCFLLFFWTGWVSTFGVSHAMFTSDLPLATFIQTLASKLRGLDGVYWHKSINTLQFHCCWQMDVDAFFTYNVTAFHKLYSPWKVPVWCASTRHLPPPPPHSTVSWHRLYQVISCVNGIR